MLREQIGAAGVEGGRKRFVIPFIQEITPGGGHKLVISRQFGMLVLHRKQVDIAASGKIKAVMFGADKTAVLTQ